MPGTQYRLDLYDTSGTKQAVLTGSAKADPIGQKSGFKALAYTKRVNYPGILQFAIRGDHEILSSLADKWQVEAWRKPSGQDWTRDFVGIYRQPQWAYGASGSTFVGLCPGLMSMLGWRAINWPAGTSNRTEFSSTVAETIMKTLVDYNAGPNATTGNGRKRTGTITGLSIETDGSNGNSQPWYCFGENLLENLQKLARIAGGDFDLVKTSSTTWQFRWYTGQLGTDRTASVIFAMERGNMVEPFYVEKRIDEATVACVWGQDEGSNRDYVTRTGDNYAAGNDIEMFVNAQDITKGDTAGLNARGDQKMDEAKARNEFTFRALQAPATLYGLHYFLGDKVTAVNPYTGASLTQKVTAVTISLDEPGQENIEPEFATV